MRCVSQGRQAGGGLNWSAADFASDTIALNFAAGTEVPGAWSLVGAAATTNYHQFDVKVDGTSILGSTSLGLGDEIELTGVYAAFTGWGFTNDGGTLKFAKLATA